MDELTRQFDYETIKAYLIKYFVIYYGVKHEKTIEKQINDLKIIIVNTKEDLVNRLNALKQKKTIELILKYLELNNVKIIYNDLIDDFDTINKKIYDNLEANKLLNKYFNGSLLDFNDAIKKEVAIDKKQLDYITYLQSLYNQYLDKLNLKETMKPSYNINKEYIRSLNLLDDDLFDKYYESKGIKLVLNKTYKDGKIFLENYLFCNINKIKEGFVDVSFIHEIVYQVESLLLNSDEITSEYKVGFCINYNNKNKENELVNEIITQAITLAITNKMHKDGIYLFDIAGNSKTSGEILYENNLFFIKELYQDYRNEILDCRINSNINMFYNLIGKKNIEDLTELINNFNNYFESTYNILMSDLIKGEETDLTRKCLDFQNEKDEIMKNIRVYNISQVINESEIKNYSF